jgi:hypothetical protein
MQRAVSNPTLELASYRRFCLSAGAESGPSGALAWVPMLMAASVATAVVYRWPGSTKPRGNSTGLGIFLRSRARIRALACISSIHFCWCRKLTASVSGGFFAVAMWQE